MCVWMSAWKRNIYVKEIFLIFFRNISTFYLICNYVIIVMDTQMIFRYFGTIELSFRMQ